ncbi:MAG: DegT/DnrJ/EryC1/StrS family aminotransferase [Deltaproteobacteria bacterium]|nr:DegT/DnrJ/EryC1/StrS family aminotransferase [Deltaproteobacteria bacterium]TLN00938.1 MAG: DegT/DnrJ/EryC1/StrS family aminotransferase [bacterium]
MEFFDLKKQYELLEPSIQNRINAVLHHRKFIMGPEIAELEEKLSSFAGCTYCVSCSSGTDALLMGLMAFGIGPGDAVFTTPFSFFATAEVISLVGATPIFVDIEEATFNIDPMKLEEAILDVQKGMQRVPGISKRLNPKAVIAVDLFGLPSKYGDINRIGKKYDLVIVEDAAQSFGGALGEKKVGSLTDIAATSFFPAKPLGCYGDGGALFTDDADLAKRLRSLREHGKGEYKYDNTRIGINGRLDTIQAAVLLGKLEVFSAELDRRQEIAGFYSEMLADIVKVPRIPEGFRSAWAQYSVLTDQREYFLEKLKKAEIPFAVYYPKPLHLQTALSYLGYHKGDFPISEGVSERIFSLPMHPYLEREEQEMIVNAIK